ncbi:type II toxin-antitoxin system RelE/ParE family toxin [Dyadobacter sediminis]|uniref:Addiction module toxin RelE n=1 Tax=Dyadobacter sediminis TaxID=1493691 RepID=A0A5R9KKR7_9BACT|nr:type II toxin-antitoxin system RelE/ParE family toxin [Dyadobacter sediminis]TLU96719.1 hypothetical protein FEM55_06240 [Dyadobacter sediminis]GGB84601.1 hypothetical protein GCM10011325_10240 [Dyadobacter sediminis]
MIKITYTPEFKKEYKRLSKKFPSPESDIKLLIEELYKNPTLGKSLGSHAYKIRCQVKSKGKGKSGGVRIITYYLEEDYKIYLLNIYDKSERQSISAKQIRDLIQSVTD